MQAHYRIFRGRLASWNELFARAARFATTLGPDRVISISHSEDHDDGVVVVWYWGLADDVAEDDVLVIDDTETVTETEAEES